MDVKHNLYTYKYSFSHFILIFSMLKNNLIDTRCAVYIMSVVVLLAYPLSRQGMELQKFH